MSMIQYKKKLERWIWVKAEKLSERLRAVASFVEKGAVVADIGSDHAYLPCYLVANGVIDKAIAGEVVKGPYESALRNVATRQFTAYITVRLANGLQAIERDDQVTTVTIAGMGGSLIATILEEGKDRLSTVTRLITQPNIHAKPIRQWAQENGWKIVVEHIMKEDEKIYEIIVLERGESNYSPVELYLGPFLMREQSAVFKEKWERERREKRRIYASLEQAEETPEIKQKKSEIKQSIKYISEVLHE